MYSMKRCRPNHRYDIYITLDALNPQRQPAAAGNQARERGTPYPSGILNHACGWCRYLLGNRLAGGSDTNHTRTQTSTHQAFVFHLSLISQVGRDPGDRAGRTARAPHTPLVALPRLGAVACCALRLRRRRLPVTEHVCAQDARELDGRTGASARQRHAS